MKELNALECSVSIVAKDIGYELRCADPIPFKQMVDATTERTKVRMVDVGSQFYDIARRFMIRLTQGDLDDPIMLSCCAVVAGLSSKSFHERFAGIVGPAPI